MIRAARLKDVEAITALQVAAATARAARDGALWPLRADAARASAEAVRAGLDGDAPLRQHWLVAETAGVLQGVVHAIHLPVPPIYAGEDGAPGLIMQGSALATDAPPGAAAALLAAAQERLETAGARIILGSAEDGGRWERALHAAGFAPLTRYLAKTGLVAAPPGPRVRPARPADIASIVALSHRNRATLHRLDPFWKPHAQADARFAAWMEKSLTLPDRDMLVEDGAQDLAGYAISQPLTPLHLPAAHDISGTGIIDDFFHGAFADPEQHLGGAGPLLAAAEAALARRGARAVLAVCPAAWSARTQAFADAGYRPALTWHIRR